VSNFVPLIAEFSLTPELLFYVFLPILIFESAYNIKYEFLHKDRVIIRTLATVGLLISAA
jgi:CPA1 family monovalent cation:H+ antiporter